MAQSAHTKKLENQLPGRYGLMGFRITHRCGVVDRGYPSIITEMTSRVPKPEAFENQANRVLIRSAPLRSRSFIFESYNRRNDCVVQFLHRVLKTLLIVGHVSSCQFERWFGSLSGR
jgi:hypothetical protein